MEGVREQMEGAKPRPNGLERPVDAQVSLAQLMALISEFSDTAILLEAADRGLTIRQGDKFGALMACAWHEKEIAA